MYLTCTMWFMCIYVHVCLYDQPYALPRLSSNITTQMKNMKQAYKDMEQIQAETAVKRSLT